MGREGSSTAQGKELSEDVASAGVSWSPTGSYGVWFHRETRGLAL